MDCEAVEPPVVHILIDDQPASGPVPHGQLVTCPRRGEVRLHECLDCDEFSTLTFDRETNETFVNCRPKVG